MLELAAGLCAGALVWRLSGSRAAAAAAVPLALLMPWTTHEHATLIPELLAPPLLLGGLLLTTREGAARPIGVLAGVLAFVKVPFVLPAAALVLVSARRREAVLWGAGTYVVLVVASLLVFGGDLFTHVVRAQLAVGRSPLADLPGVWAQGAWNELGLAACVFLAWRFRGALEPGLARNTAIVALATVALFFTTVKLGTSLTVLVPIEAVLLPLALAGTAAAAKAGGRRWAIAGCAAIAFCLVQSVALVAEPDVEGRHPFLRPGSAPSYGINLDAKGVDAAAAVARACPEGAAYSGPPFIAFEAERRLAAGQPDPFLTTRSDVLDDVRRRIDADTRRCPQPPPRIP